MVVENLRPSNGLAQGLETTQNTSVVRQRRQTLGVLTDEPVEKLRRRSKHTVCILLLQLSYRLV